MRIVLALALLCTGLPAPASAGTHVVQRGETLEHVAAVHGCTVDAVLRANRLKTTLVRAGTVVEIPTCSMRTRARTRERTQPAPRDDTDRARQALAVIDGATVIA
ncbi:MAG: LysM peptidoglycan-binding domain-containing protein, partial [Deltaproteobacteria bacterium]|nr:LysM peptidoglycan-binding domain-containing protein [Deltaproteobacteria bacterium]